MQLLSIMHRTSPKCNLSNTSLFTLWQCVTYGCYCCVHAFWRCSGLLPACCWFVSPWGDVGVGVEKSGYICKGTAHLPLCPCRYRLQCHRCGQHLLDDQLTPSHLPLGVMHELLVGRWLESPCMILLSTWCWISSHPHVLKMTPFENPLSMWSCKLNGLPYLASSLRRVWLTK